MISMCRVFGVSKSGYFKWLDVGVSKRLSDDNVLITKIEKIFNENKKSYGARRIRNELINLGINCSRRRVSRLMKLAGICPVIRRKFVVTTDSKHDSPTHPNLLDRDFSASCPNEKWVSDITYIPTDDGWLYLSVVIDLFAKRVVGWSMADNLKAKLVTDALNMAVMSRKPVSGLIHHSDRGIQYACSGYQKMLDTYGITCSMSRKGNCWDNAVAESFFATLKKDCVYKKKFRKFKTKNEARMEIFHYIETFYNRKRTHSKLGYKSPVEYEAEIIGEMFEKAA
jgi:putative transposase